jgi:hypothetical protein
MAEKPYFAGQSPDEVAVMPSPLEVSAGDEMGLAMAAGHTRCQQARWLSAI